MTSAATHVPHYTPSNPFTPEKLMRDAPHLRDAAYFIKYFNPYINMQAEGEESRAGTTEWLTFNSRLGFNKLQKALTQTGQPLGWFSSVNTNVIGIDIDDHGPRGGWLSSSETHHLTPSRRLSTLYKEVMYRFGFEPSLTVRSPRGLHLYYMLDERLHYTSLNQLTRQLLGPIKVELKPTPTTFLRVPNKLSIVDPFNITSQLYQSASDRIDWESIKIYPPEHLFGPDYRSDLRIFTPAKSDSSSATFTLSSKHLREVEAAYMPFTNGDTNDPLIHLIGGCRSAGMDLQSTISYVYSWLDRSPFYSGDLGANPLRLKKRITKIYEHEKPAYLIQYASGSPSPSTTRKRRVQRLSKAPNIQRIASRYPHPKQAQNGLATFLANIILWKLHHDRILTNPDLLHQMNDKYPFYIHNRHQGFYPLPHSLLTSWNSRHARQLKWLISTGVLEPAPFSQLPRLNVCKYYKITWPISHSLGA